MLEPTVVYIESYTGAMYFDGIEIVRRYRTAHEVLRRVALDEHRSRELLRQAAREHDRER
ncbi:Scr1 family TA system antitoxin-like transcriptional regulator [Nocardia uniformis]|uniref:Scr1 family TA system antitoxin-like transcriptional regulator n=1 Tax=Nocardia uniformis TaxID=53432 RepID=UPI0027D797D6|nr:Scr1 family TA system antitoxin-like transcriptional regulator [Nocardia uniformis]